MHVDGRVHQLLKDELRSREAELEGTVRKCFPLIHDRVEKSLWWLDGGVTYGEHMPKCAQLDSNYCTQILLVNNQIEQYQIISKEWFQSVDLANCLDSAYFSRLWQVKIIPSIWIVDEGSQSSRSKISPFLQVIQSPEYQNVCEAYSMVSGPLVSVVYSVCDK